MVFATDTVTVALPDEAVRTHASVVVLFLVADAGCLSIEEIVLFFSDQNLLAGATDVDKISLLIVLSFHGVSSCDLPRLQRRRKQIKGLHPMDTDPVSHKMSARN